jgi:hypothetical protein
MFLRVVEIGFVLVAGGVAIRQLARMARAWVRLEGARLVTCTATGLPAAVRTNALRSAVTSFLFRSPRVRIINCSLWATGKPCDQGCVPEALEGESAVQSIVARWYEKRTCVYCANPIAAPRLLAHRAALLSPRGTTREWSDVPPDRLLDSLRTDSPVCWNCHVAVTLRRKHPELVTDRPWRKNVDRGAA